MKKIFEGHDGHLGHVTWYIYNYIGFTFIQMLSIKFDFDWPCRKIGKGHPRVMIYTNFVKLHCLMLHDKFQSHMPSGSGEEDFKGLCCL